MSHERIGQLNLDRLRARALHTRLNQSWQLSMSMNGINHTDTKIIEALEKRTRAQINQIEKEIAEEES